MELIFPLVVASEVKLAREPREMSETIFYSSVDLRFSETGWRGGGGGGGEGRSLKNITFLVIYQTRDPVFYHISIYF